MALAQYDDASSSPTSIVPTASSIESWLQTSSPGVLAPAVVKKKFPSNFGDVKIAHAALGAAAFLFVFPLGGIIIKIWDHRHIAWIHAAIQTFGLVVFGASTGLGIWMAMQMNAVRSPFHFLSFRFLPPPF